MQNPPPPHHDQGPRKPQYTLALVGSDRCGKTSLMRRLLFGSYEIPTNQVSEMNWEQFQTHLQDTNGLYIPILALKRLCSNERTSNFDPFYRFPTFTNDYWNEHLIFNLLDLPPIRARRFQQTIMKGLGFSDGIIFMIDCFNFQHDWKSYLEQHYSSNFKDTWKRTVIEPLQLVLAAGNIKDIIFVVNKMDLIGYSEEFFKCMEQK